MIIGKKLDIQKTVDGLIDKVFLRFIPYSVKPNHVTVVRFILVPIIYLLLRSGMFDVGLVVFIIAACTDFIDGAMARTRNQITNVGKIIDPIADKLLIMSVLLYIGLDYLIVKIFVIFIIGELIAVLMGAFLSFSVGRPIGANIFGKIKMILQSFSVGLFILGILVKNNLLIIVSEYILFIALIFAVASGLEHIRLKIEVFPKIQK
jgi:CDP-diacylglycerol--glycerol-3-phosphate 3-phosphatidyltransferase